MTRVVVPSLSEALYPRPIRLPLRNLSRPGALELFVPLPVRSYAVMHDPDVVHPASELTYAYTEALVAAMQTCDEFRVMLSGGEVELAVELGRKGAAGKHGLWCPQSEQQKERLVRCILDTIVSVAGWHGCRGITNLELNCSSGWGPGVRVFITRREAPRPLVRVLPPVDTLP